MLTSDANDTPTNTCCHSLTVKGSLCLAAMLNWSTINTVA